MKESEQIPRNSLAWLLFSQAVILAPHTTHTPAWIWVIWFLVVGWRWQIFRGAWGYPGRWIKFLLVASCCLGIYWVYRGNFGVQTMVGLLVIGFILKLVEMRKRNDLLLLCHLGYFVVATQFLFFSNVLAAAYGFISILVLTATLLASHQSLDQHKFWRTLRLTSLLVLQAVPLMLLLFLVAPRVGALWSVPLNTTGAKTGMSDSMSPGDISELMRSQELVFRARFDETPPHQSLLYWRGLVFSYFDGRRWSQSNQQNAFNPVSWQDQRAAVQRDQIHHRGQPTNYQIILEPTRQPWLFALTAPQQWSSEAGLSRELILQRKQPVNQRMQYRVTSFLDYLFEPNYLEDWQRKQELQLPPNSNPRTRELAQRWLAETGSPHALIKKLLAHFNSRFHYTLQPPQLGLHSVDEFLWQTQRGFCEHFSSSFVFFLRAAGIPARVVVGYQGGEFNPVEKYYAVRQREAHAWAEVWLAGEGWVVVDPTAAVAPERIEQGADLSLSEEDALLLDKYFLGDIALLTKARLRWEALNYNWSRWVLSYDADLQSELLARLLGGKDLWRLALFVVGGGALILGAIAALLLWGRRKTHLTPADRYYSSFCKKLVRLGFHRGTGEAPGDFATRITLARPDLSPAVGRVTELYQWASYADNDAAVKDLRLAIRKFSPERKK